MSRLIVVLAVCLLAIAFASLVSWLAPLRSYEAKLPPRLVVVRECGRVWHVPASSSGDFKRAVRLDCFFLTPRHERPDRVVNFVEL
jgi:hypothetical protein